MITINHETYCGQDLVTLLLKAGFDWQDYFVAHSIDEHFHWEIPLHIVQRWLREVKGYAVSVYPSDESDGWLVSLDLIEDSSSIWTKDLNKTYEEALEAGVKKCLEIILEKGK